MIEPDSPSPPVVPPSPDQGDNARVTAVAGPSRAGRVGMIIVVTGLCLALDLLTKQWAWTHLRPGPAVVLVEHWAYLEFGFNTGSAFSLLHDMPWSRFLFIGISIATLIYMGYLARTLPLRWGHSFVAIALIASGALGNLHDRLFRVISIDGLERHGVVDFIKIYYWRNKPWPTFNVADVALIAGILLLLLFLSRHGDALDETPGVAELVGEGRPMPYISRAPRRVLRNPMVYSIALPNDSSSDT